VPLRFGGRYFIDNPPLEFRTADHDNGVKLIFKSFSGSMSMPIH
jgi:hypothetical protein